MTVRIASLDHLVLTVADIPRTVAFYERVLGMEARGFGAGRVALHYGSQKINLHPLGNDIEPKAQAPTAGSADLCFVAETPVEAVVAHLNACGVPVVAGPVTRSGAMGPIRSVYFRDPDLNLIEVSNY